jgi:hypothetical protein
MVDFLQRKIILKISYRLGHKVVCTQQNHRSDILKSNIAFPSWSLHLRIAHYTTHTATSEGCRRVDWNILRSVLFVLTLSLMRV